MDGAADAVALEVGEIEALGHQALAGEGRVAVHQEGHDLAALGVVALVLLGAHLAQHHRIDRLEMRGLGDSERWTMVPSNSRSAEAPRWYFTSPEPRISSGCEERPWNSEKIAA